VKLAWSERALAQLEHAVNTVAEENPAAAWRIYDRIQEKAQRLMEFPKMGTEGREPDTRELVITGTRYTLIYRITGEIIEVAAVWHWAQSRKR
jgi:toxin ParE1/3/4